MASYDTITVHCPVAGPTYYTINNFPPGGDISRDWVYNSGNSSSGTICSINTEPSFADLWTFNPNGIINVGDVMLDQSGGAMPNGWYSYYEPDGSKVWVEIVTNSVSGYVAQKGYCNAYLQTYNEITAVIASSYIVQVNSQYPVHSNIEVTVAVQYYNQGLNELFIINLYKGNSYGEVYTNSLIESLDIIDIYPASDEAYYYTPFNNDLP